MGYDMEKETNDRKQTMMDMTGLREKPLKDKKSNMEQEQPYHMTSIVRRLFPGVEWRVGKGLVDRKGKSVYKVLGKTLYPDFLSTELGLIIEIDGDGIGKVGGHFTSSEKANEDLEKIETYRKFDYRVISIPPYIQLDTVMITYYFGIDYPVKLYPAVSEHGFAHPLISLPASFCKLGVDRFNRDMEAIPQCVRDKIIQTLKDRIVGFEKEGFSHDDAMAKVLLPSMWKYVK